MNEADGQDKHALFEQWALPHKDHIYTACLYRTRRREEADDLFQDTYLRAFRFFHQFTPGTNCRAWLLTIMNNTFKNHAPQRRWAVRTLEFEEAVWEYEQKLLAEGATGWDDPAALLLSRLLDHEVTDALHSLPEEHRMTLVLIDLEELTYKEAATVLGCPIGTVRSRLSRARRLLRAMLSPYARKRGYLKAEDRELSIADYNCEHLRAGHLIGDGER
ncbi:MAG: sigma-70 family RNA polymerase sigma factor [Candidatus Binatia bacterium]